MCHTLVCWALKFGATSSANFHWGGAASPAIPLDPPLNCRTLRARARPRTAQLRRLTGRSWGHEERQLRVVASGYVRGAPEHKAAAWLPATSTTHVELSGREMRAADRTITSCPLSTPSHAVMAEAGMLPMAARRTVLAARFLAKARALPEGDPFRPVADADPRTGSSP